MSQNAMTHVLLTDDDGSGTTGTVINDSLFDQVQDAIDAAIGQIVQTKSGNYTVVVTDDCVICTATLTLALYAAAGNSGKTLEVINAGTAPSVVTIDPNASETIDGALTLILVAGQRARIRCNGSNWFTTDMPNTWERVAASADSGSTTNAAAENVATAAISGLTAKDTLRVIFTFESVTQLTTTPLLYSNTDSVALLNIANGTNCSAGHTHQGEATLRPRQGSTVNLAATYVGNGSFNAVIGVGGVPTVTTAWTSPWTLALRHAGVVAGGTFKWSWAVYIIRGQ